MKDLEPFITEVTRRDIANAMTSENLNWFGYLSDIEFLEQLYDLETLPSFDPRFPNAARDIWQHRVNNYDWEDRWVFDDPRFDLLQGNDEDFLRFLAKTVHPLVRPDVRESRHLVDLYNSFLAHDGFQIVEDSRISGKPVYGWRRTGVPKTPGIEAAREAWSGTDMGYIKQQIDRMERSIEDDDPELAIGTAKELVETCCKTILEEHALPVPNNASLPQLVKATVKALRLTPDDIPDEAKARDLIRRILSNLATIAAGLAELRGKYGSGHGKRANAKGLGARHARLAVGAASTLSVFLAETHQESQEEPRADNSRK